MANIEHKDATQIHKGRYIQTADPGAVGTGVEWLDTNTSPAIHKKRNAANTGWDEILDPSDYAPLASPTFTGTVTSVNELHTGYLDVAEIADPGSPSADRLRLWVEDLSGVTTLRSKDSGGLIHRHGRDVFMIVKNETGSTIARGKAVYINGADAGQIKPTIALAKADADGTMPAHGVTREDIADGAYGRVLIYGIVDGLDTSAWAAGAKLYVSDGTAGLLTTTAPSTRSQMVAVVLLSHASTGHLQVVVGTPSLNGVSGSGTSTGAAVKKTGTQSIANDTDVVVTFDSETYDTGTLHDNSTNSSRITAPTTGYYVVWASLEYDGSIGGNYREAKIVANGTTALARSRQKQPDNASVPAEMVVTCVALLAAGEYVEVRARQNSGGALNVTANSYFGAHLITPSNSGASAVEFMVAASDETTALTTGTAKTTFRMPFAMVLTSVRASLTTASSSGLVTVDINEGGVSILSTKLTIDANEKTSTTAATPAVISDTTLADDAEMTIDIDGAGTGAAGLKVYLIGTRV